MGYSEIKENISDLRNKPPISFSWRSRQKKTTSTGSLKKSVIGESFVRWDEVKNGSLMEPFELLLHQDVLDALRKTRGENRKQLNSLLSVLPTNPYLQADGSFG